MTVCARDGCDLPIERPDPRSKYCSARCRKQQGDKIYRQAHAEAIIEQQKIYRQNNHRALLQKKQEYYQDNRAARNEANSRWVAQNREKVTQISTRWKERNRLAVAEIEARRRSRKREGITSLIPAQDLQGRMEYFGHKCWMCKANADSLDHVKPLAKGGAHILSNLRPACRSCNTSKGAKWFGVSNINRFKKECNRGT